MNPDSDHHPLPRQPTINECLRERHTTNPAHSNGKPVVPSTTTNINVRFAPISSLELEIKQAMKTTPALSQTIESDTLLLT
jgi:hypothetical protein